MKSLKKRLIIILTAVMLISGWGTWGLLVSILPDSYFSWYPIIPCFYYIMGLVLIQVITRDKRENELKLVNLYMIIKLAKVAACILLGGIYFLAIAQQIRDFVIVFVGFYLLYLGLETYFFYLTEEIIKKKKVDEQLT